MRGMIYLESELKNANKLSDYFDYYQIVRCDENDACFIGF
jgi:hypothetical protein